MQKINGIDYFLVTETLAIAIYDHTDFCLAHIHDNTFFCICGIRYCKSCDRIISLTEEQQTIITLAKEQF